MFFEKAGDYFHPACFQMLLSKNWFKTSLSWPLTVTLPGFVGFLYCRWSPLVLHITHPSASSILITSLTLYLFMLMLLFDSAKIVKIIPLRKFLAIKDITFNTFYIVEGWKCWQWPPARDAWEAFNHQKGRSSARDVRDKLKAMGTFPSDEMLNLWLTTKYRSIHLVNTKICSTFVVS